MEDTLKGYQVSSKATQQEIQAGFQTSSLSLSMKSMAYLAAPGSCFVPEIGHIFAVHLHFMPTAVT